MRPFEMTAARREQIDRTVEAMRNRELRRQHDVLVAFINGLLWGMVVVVAVLLVVEALS